ncbi:glycosyltransferase family 4 protein [Afipia sp. TerB]
MRIAIVDYSGHAFPVHLARALAAKGHDLIHLYFSEFQSPHGKLERVAGDPTNLQIKPVSLGVGFPKYSFFRRRLHEIKIGKAFAAEIEAFQPDIVLAGNCPLDCALEIGKSTRRTNRRFIFWQQDIYSTAISRILGRKLGFTGRLIGSYYRRMERRILQMSHATIVISHDFVDSIRREFGITTGNVHVIENWAPLDEIPIRPKNNSWAADHGLIDKKIVLYSGTIGLKHDPQQILELARGLREDVDARIVVVSEGPFARALAGDARELGLGNLLVLPFQPFDAFPDVLGSADIAIAILEPDAGAFSVPSKVLSYLCAGRPVVLSAPPENLAARIIDTCKAGKVVAAGDRNGFVAAVRELIADSQLRATAGQNARAYAETTFDIDVISTRFEAIFREALMGLEATKLTTPVIVPAILPPGGSPSPSQ